MKKSENGIGDAEEDEEEEQEREDKKERSKINKKGYYEEQDEIKKRLLN